jgi:hypothetical protein
MADDAKEQGLRMGAKNIGPAASGDEDGPDPSSLRQRHLDALGLADGAAHGKKKAQR